MPAFAPKFFGQIHVAGYTSVLGQSVVPNGQDVHDRIPKDFVRIPTPATYGDLKAGDYVIEKTRGGNADLFQINDVTVQGKKDEIGVFAFNRASTGRYLVGTGVGFDLTDPIERTPYTYEVYRRSDGSGNVESGGTNKTTLIIGGLALAAIAGGAIYFATRS